MKSVVVFVLKILFKYTKHAPSLREKAGNLAESMAK